MSSLEPIYRTRVRGALSGLEERELAAVRRAAILETAGSYSAGQRRAWLSAQQQDDGAASACEVVVASTHGRAVGYAELDIAEGHMGGLFVAPARHRAGIGSNLFALVQQLTWRAGHTKLSLCATPDATPFYERRGCERLSQLPLALDNEVLICVFLTKALDKGPPRH